MSAVLSSANLDETTHHPKRLASVPGLLLMSTSLLCAPTPLFFSTTTPASYALVRSPFDFGINEDLAVKSTAPTYRTTAQRVELLRTLSGLNVAQVGRLMGVSRRSIHGWISGAVMSRSNEEKLAQLLEIVASLSGDAGERRAALLDSSHGQSRFHQLVQQNGSRAVIQVNSPRPVDRLQL